MIGSDSKRGATLTQHAPPVGKRRPRPIPAVQWTPTRIPPQNRWRHRSASKCSGAGPGRPTQKQPPERESWPVHRTVSSCLLLLTSSSSLLLRRPARPRRLCHATKESKHRPPTASSGLLSVLARRLEFASWRLLVEECECQLPSMVAKRDESDSSGRSPCPIDISNCTLW